MTRCRLPLVPTRTVHTPSADMARLPRADAPPTPERILTLRQQRNPDPKCLEYPFSFVDEYFLTPERMPGQPAVAVGDFPNNIEHFYWIREGSHEWDPWMTLCRLTSGVYVFYKGECGYTGFDVQGDMKLYSSMDPAVLIQMAMGDHDYQRYFWGTETTESGEKAAACGAGDA